MKRVGWFGGILLALLALRAVLMATMPVFDPSEARYAAISANMARNGDFVVPHFTHRGRYQSFDGKPPLVFQAGGVCCKALGTENPMTLQFGVRVFPLLSAILLLAIVYGVVARKGGRERARIAVAVTATTTAFFAAAGIAMTDMSLACAVSGALLLYGVFAEIGSWGAATGVMALLGAGMIIKGPVALVMFALPVFADLLVNRRWRAVFNWKWLATLPVFLLVAVPWFVIVERQNPGAVWYFFYNENFLRFVSHDYGDKYGAGREAFRGVSIVWAFVATLPWALLPLCDAVKRLHASGWRISALKSAEWRRFEVIAILAIVGFWCLTSRVLIYYLFPVIALFGTWLALHVEPTRLKRLVPPAALVTALVTVGALVGGMLGSDKMLGAKAPQYFGFRNSYSHEFYHGTAKECLGAGIDIEKLKAAVKRDRELKKEHAQP